MTKRQQLIDKGKIWQVTRNLISGGEELLFEGVKTKCIKYMREKGLYRLWKNGKSSYSLCQIIWEA